MMRKLGHNVISYLLVAVAVASIGLWWYDSKGVAKKQREFAEATRTGSWALNTKTGELTWDDMMFKIFDQDKEKFHPTYPAFRELLHPEDRDIVNARVEASIRGDHYNFSATYRVITTKDIHYVRASGGMASDGITFFGICTIIEDGALEDNKRLFRLEDNEHPFHP